MITWLPDGLMLTAIRRGPRPADALASFMHAVKTTKARIEWCLGSEPAVNYCHVAEAELVMVRSFRLRNVRDARTWHGFLSARAGLLWHGRTVRQKQRVKFQ